MAVRGTDVKVLGEGIQADAPSKGSFALNMLYLNNCWQARKGFGQVTQFDTTMANPIDPGVGSEAAWGYRKHLGSRLIKTNFGNLQMLSVFLADVNTADVRSAPLAPAPHAPVFPIYLVSIYDLTTKERFEVPLYIHTSQTLAAESFEPTGTGETTPGRIITPVTVTSAPDAAGQYQTSVEGDFAAWIRAADEFFFFEEYGDILYFGNSVVGLWAYIPASFNGTRPMSIDKLNRREPAHAYSESSMVTPVVLSPGINPEAFVYLRTSDMPRSVDVTVVQNRMVYASGFSLYFSDPGFPSAVMANNVFAVPTEEPIVAIAEHNSNVMIFTQSETWLYQPSIGDIVSAGKLTRVSDHVGCVGPNAITSMGEALLWMDESGVHSTTGGLSVGVLSGPVLPLFEGEGLSNPLTDFYLGDGATWPFEQYQSTLALRPKGVCATYVPALRALFFTIPELDGALVLTGSKWAWWSFQSMVQKGTFGARGIHSNIRAPWLIAYQDDLLLIGGADVQELEDLAEYQAPVPAPVGEDTISRSFYILQYGRGGAIDRSTSTEDHRRVSGAWVKHAQGALPLSPTGGVFFHDPIHAPDGYSFQGGLAVVGTGPVFWVPVTVVQPDVFDPTAVPPQGVDSVLIMLSYDNSHWRPVTTGGATSIVDVFVPPERLPGIQAPSEGGVSGWDVSLWADPLATTPSINGPWMKIQFDGNLSTSLWTHRPKLNLNTLRHNPLLFIPFSRDLPGTIPDPKEVSVSGMGWYLSGGPHLEDQAAALTARVPLNIFNRWSMGTLDTRDEDRAAQPVDWAYKSTNVGLDQGDVVKMRGTWTNMLSHGTGYDRITNTTLWWPYGLFNTVVGSDRKEWMAQYVDYAGDPPAIDAVRSGFSSFIRRTLRTRVISALGTLVTKIFQRRPAPGEELVWGNTGVATAPGNVLIGDEDTSTISISMGVKGQSFSVMHFGHMMNRAEKMMIEDITATVRTGKGSRRRRGH